MGAGPCLASCGPILISYIAATKTSPLSGLRSWFIFSFSRLAVTIFLGFIAGIAGSELFKRFYWEVPGYIIWFLAGLFISFLGIIIFFKVHTKYRLCSLLNDKFIKHDTKSLVILGMLIGIMPCVPLMGIISYITMVSTHYTDGIFMAAAFGLGTIFSPLIFLAAASGAIGRFKPLHNEKNLSLFQRACGVILLFFGMHIILRTVVEFMSMR